ncbi:PREDICTED: uncharacterized protein LOC109222760 [Nicotiana attenuata]|uniref:uncharacterized protein LOC109222760 n=1 Tax=Nicotiana attenuata TaxID=49451 RepID=UPI00090587EE|nr:PREDICTED: uncharacterized protein LOC109222760 [Nicotiana attenuata]XP_019242625.1 PREDICTED: uncharacterized protein LOC109222760 [Nicotiana attenuata]
MGPEHPGRLRLYGRGVTKTSLKRKVGDIGTSSSSTDEMLQQKMVEMEERMKQRMQEKFNAQKDAMELQVAVNIISQLKRLNPDLKVDPSMLAFNARSPVDASSAQQAAVQLINRLSTGSNNRGQYVLFFSSSSFFFFSFCCFYATALSDKAFNRASFNSAGP